MDRDNDRGGKLAFPRLCTRVEVPSGEDSEVLGVENQLREAGEEFSLVLRKEGDGEAVDGELGFVGAEAEGQPERLSHWERLVELAGQGIKVRCEGGSGGGRSVTRRVTDPRSLTLVMTGRGRIQFASLRTRAAMSGKVAAIRAA